MSSGATSTVVECTTANRTMGLGSGAGQFSINSTEFQFFFNSGLSLGGATCGSQRVSGITAENSLHIGGILTLLVNRDDCDVVFANTGSTFYALAAQADSGILVGVNIGTTTGSLYLDGDLENSSTADPETRVIFSNSTTASASQMLTLEATTGTLYAHGILSLNAGTGVILLNDFTQTVADGMLHINADFESGGDGTFTVTTGKALNNLDGKVSITAWDIDVAGTIPRIF